MDKLILGTLFLGMIFVSSCKTTKVDYSEHPCVKKIIAVDAVAGKTRNHSCEKNSLSSTILEYTSFLERLDFSSCPLEFKESFSNHIEAWKAIIPITDKYPDMRGEMHDLFDKIQQGENGKAFKKLVDKIWSTWSDVEVYIEKK